MKIGQIDLFTKRVRKVKAPDPIERSIHIAVADLLRLSIRPGWIWFHVPNGELRTDATGALLKRMGVLPGVSDFLLIGPPHGLIHVLELKRRGHKPNDEQAAFMKAIHMAGGEAAWVDSFDGAVTQLTTWKAIRASIDHGQLRVEAG